MELITTNSMNYLNNELAKAHATIAKCGEHIKSRQYTIAATVAAVQAKGAYEQDGYANAAEWVCAAFGVKKSTAYTLLKIGQEYTRPVLDSAGHTRGHCSNLLGPTDGEAPIYDFTTSQIERMMTLGRDKVVELVNMGELKPQMTVRELIDKVKAIKVMLNPPADLMAEENAFDEGEQMEVTPYTVTSSDDSERAESEESPIHCGPRPELFDLIETSQLVAELKARNFTVYDDRDGGKLWCVWGD